MPIKESTVKLCKAVASAKNWTPSTLSLRTGSMEVHYKAVQNSHCAKMCFYGTVNLGKSAAKFFVSGVYRVVKGRFTVVSLVTNKLAADLPRFTVP